LAIIQTLLQLSLWIMVATNVYLPLQKSAITLLQLFRFHSFHLSSYMSNLLLKNLILAK